MSKKENRDVEVFVRAVDQEDPAKAKDYLEKALKEKCAKKIAKVLKEAE